jgi:hypothetical protein
VWQDPCVTGMASCPQDTANKRVPRQRQAPRQRRAPGVQDAGEAFMLREARAETSGSEVRRLASASICCSHRSWADDLSSSRSICSCFRLARRLSRKSVEMVRRAWQMGVESSGTRNRRAQRERMDTGCGLGQGMRR